ncbi:MAG: SRPBCC family protein [Methanococcaceae archaeon]
MTESNQKTEDQELIITRVFDAPRNRVWEVWTEPEHVMEWWGPEGFTAPIIKTDFRVGGKSLFCMRSPEGEDFWSTGVYQEIVEQEKIVTTDSFSDAQGNVVPASHYGMSGDWPLELLVTVTFEEDGGKTKLTLRHEGFPDRENRDLAKAGWNESLDKLVEYLKKI